MMEAKPELRTITVAHSPDSDDAFMFYGLATNKLETDGLKFEHTLKDIQSLNEDAKNGVFDVTAISFHAYAYISDKYALLPHGASIGDKYGPILVSKEHYKPEDIPNLKIAIPGELTSAFLALKIYNQDFEYTVVPFDEIIDTVLNGKADAGLLIHEGQLFYKQMGLEQSSRSRRMVARTDRFAAADGRQCDPARSRRRFDAAGVESPSQKHRLFDGKPRRRAFLRDAVCPRYAAGISRQVCRDVG